MSTIKIHPSWYSVLETSFQQPWFQNIRQFLLSEKEAGKVIFPPDNLLFNAFDKTPFEAVKVVILGQDPYHNPGEAMGLSFSVPRGVSIPPSLKNIYQELQKDVGFTPVGHGDLIHWAEQGVFLLNAFLTVEKNKAASHQKIGWQHFTDDVIRVLSEKREGLVFMLWGRFAQTKRELIDTSRHLVLEAAHPSPLARGAFFGSRPFSQANAYLQAQGQNPIDWQLP